jgi:hypothetical protein
VNVEQEGVPADEAVAFGIYLRRFDDGTWDIVRTGSEIKMDDLPDAPPELFMP